MTEILHSAERDLMAIERELEHLNRLARTLDSRFRLPGTSIRFGLDTIVGLVPVIGDLFDVGFKANLRNVAILREQLGARKQAHSAAPGPARGIA
ncbi:DUF4112 domain-containing protein [Hoeflea sp.]|uniref:DUF4112 domain-containing protein n=1 Tax=Hoeflea sp. TaxID=1940281 RepID=UPI003A8DC6F5